MESTCEILDLPDLALFNICTHITCPFDLLHFGNTCSRIRQISSSTLLWQAMCFRSLHGLWMHLEECSVEDNPREWLLEVIRKIINKKTDTKQSCVFLNREQWIRKDTLKFRFLVRLLQISYSTDKDPHPAVLHEQWLYDIGIFERCNAVMNFLNPTLNVDLPIATELSNLSQAAERDLRLRKQPFKDKRYYIKHMGSTNEDGLFDLFPSSDNGSLCPLLLVPTEKPIFSDILGIASFFPCISEILVKHLSKHYKLLNIHMMTLWEIIKTFCVSLVCIISREVERFEERLLPYTLKDVLSTLFDGNPYNVEIFEGMRSYYSLRIPYREVVAEFCTLLDGNESKTVGIEVIQANLRRQLVHEVRSTLFPPHKSSNHCVVSRVNLTDSDLIGGDNSHQEMSCAALISDHGVLVTWQLVGRSRY